MTTQVATQSSYDELDDSAKNLPAWPVLALIWGSSFILMKRGLYHEEVAVLTSWQVATARLSIAWPISRTAEPSASFQVRRCSRHLWRGSSRARS